jgi:hypothetical protein
MTTKRGECYGGPYDGKVVTVASLSRLPDRISYPSQTDMGKRDVYVLVGDTESVRTYRYETTEAVREG